MPLRYRVLTGPTASGKTALLLARAASHPLIVVSADSRQVYRGMDIGTGKPTVAEQRAVPHYGLDLRSPGEDFSAHDFLLIAAGAFAALADDPREVWVSGGTGLYIRALTEQLPLGPAPRKRLRARLAELIQQHGPEELARMLGVELRESKNPVRVIRAAELTCRDAVAVPLIYMKASLTPADVAADEQDATGQGELEVARQTLARWSCAGIVVVDPGYAELRQRIEARVKNMFEMGLTDEVQALRAAGFGASKVVAKGIAYREAGELLDGRLTRSEAIERAVIRTRQYAKRQRTYFAGRGWQVIRPEDFAEWAESSS